MKALADPCPHELYILFSCQNLPTNPAQTFHLHSVQGQHCLISRLCEDIIWPNYWYVPTISFRQVQQRSNTRHAIWRQNSITIRYSDKKKIRSRSTLCNRLSQPPSWHSSQGYRFCWAAAHASCAKLRRCDNGVFTTRTCVYSGRFFSRRSRLLLYMKKWATHVF